ncbi:flagellar motor switch protein FliG [Paracoccus homiensis]|uniref:Flagellar motor switch protein FliG n=2 Tax=Paracoccus homiensis TaxID=364199 RepID=A0A1I0C3R6_9RHOB|nr:flagellar motor switch protein FliG [Paracoccus homiensis]
MTMVQMALTQRQKAAVIVRLLLDDEDEVRLNQLDSATQNLLAEEMAGMELIDRQTRDAVITEFCDRLESVGVTFPGNLDGTLAMLGGKLSADSTDHLRRIAAMSGKGDPWARIAELPQKSLLALANSESVELIALMLSKLPVPVASALFTELSRDRARTVAQAMSLTGEVSPAALHRVGLVLLQAADALPRPGLATPASDRMGAILNFATAELRDDVLDSLEREDAGFAGGVRRAIFIFAHIPSRVEPRDVPRITREVDQAVLIRALSSTSGPEGEAANFILSNLSQRMADGLREEIEGLGKVALRDVEAAGNELVAAIRRLESQGDLTLVPLVTDDELG